MRGAVTRDNVVCHARGMGFARQLRADPRRNEQHDRQHIDHYFAERVHQTRMFHHMNAERITVTPTQAHAKKLAGRYETPMPVVRSQGQMP
jgi:phospholipase/lecithinase/hemolysin